MGLTLRQLARLTGLDYSTIALYEAGQRNPGPTARAAIARELHRSEGYLFPVAAGESEKVPA